MKGKPLIIAALVACTPAAAHADLAHGFGSFSNGGFDFSEQQAATDFFDSDAAIISVFDPPLGFIVAGALVLVPGSSIDDVTSAPTDSTAYGFDSPIRFDVTYVVRCLDGLYAKFRFMGTEEDNPAWDFEYYVQLDGTKDLDSTVPVDASTWGRVKALYGQ